MTFQDSELDEFLNCKETISKLEDVITQKVELLKRKQSELEAKQKSEKINTTWLTEVKNDLPAILSDIIKTDINKELNNDKDYESDHLKLYQLLKEMHEKQVEAVVDLNKHVAKQKNEVKRLQQNLKYGDNKKHLESDSEDEDADKKFEELNTKSSQLFNSSKNNLKYVLENFFDERMQDLTKQLTNAYFKGGDEQYIEYDPVYADQVLELKYAEIVVRHPTNVALIKFNKFF